MFGLPVNTSANFLFYISELLWRCRLLILLPIALAFLLMFPRAIRSGCAQVALPRGVAMVEQAIAQD